MTIWNPWHGCHKISPGCQNCYVYRRDESIGKDAGIVTKTNDFDLPLRKNKQKAYKVQPSDGIVYTCMTSDFFLEDGDLWRPECWRMIKERADLRFAIITKRIHRFMECIPDDWGEGYPNVMIFCTVENQQMADYRLPLFLKMPIRRRAVCHEPMLGPIDISKFLEDGQIEYVLCGGESGPNARPCFYDWILKVRDQCIQNDVTFHFKQTGAVFVKEGKAYHIDRRFQQTQAAKAGIDYKGRREVDDFFRKMQQPDEAAEQMELTELMERQKEGITNKEGLADREKLLRDAENSGREEILSHEEWLQIDLFERISRSNFRSRFKLKPSDKQYVKEKGMDVIRSHAEDFVSKRLAPAVIPNDGKQTPMRGHPVFLAQHSCGCCCRGCLEKWHGIKAGTNLTEEQQIYIVDTLMEWIRRQCQ